jgi:hypothetical protein
MMRFETGLVAACGGYQRRLARAGKLVTFVGILVATRLHSQEQDTVWVWDPVCHNACFVAIRVRLDGAAIYRDSIPVCRAERRLEKGKSSFRFTSRRPVVWYGYRNDAGDTTAANTPFEIDLWQAGGDTDAILLGVSAVASDGIHMNTIHVLTLTKPSETTLAPGLVLETSPEVKR